MKLGAAFCLLIGLATLTSRATAQATGGGTFTEMDLYSLYAKRHAATIEFANLAVTRAADDDVRKAAEELVRAHREARAKLEQIASEQHLVLAPPENDTSSVLLAQARASLNGKVGRSFDSTWVALAHDWLSTLILDNNRVVKAHITPEMRPVAQEHTTWLFHQSADIEKLRKKFK